MFLCVCLDLKHLTSPSACIITQCFIAYNILSFISLLNPYSVLTPPGGVLGFLKINHVKDIFLFIACKIRKYLIFIQKTRNMSDAVRVKYK